MFELHCDELIRALSKRAEGLRTKLLQRMAKEHQALNKKYNEIPWFTNKSEIFFEYSIAIISILIMFFCC